MASKQVNDWEKNLTHPYKNFSANIVDIKGRTEFLILIYLACISNQIFCPFLDETIYMEFQA